MICIPHPVFFRW